MPGARSTRSLHRWRLGHPVRTQPQATHGRCRHMNNQPLEGRKMLQRAGLWGAGALAGLAPLTAQAEQGGDGHSIEGAWLIRVTPEGAPQSATYEVLNLYTMGGGV